jgi:hypothetical protein
LDEFLDQCRERLHCRPDRDGGLFCPAPHLRNGVAMVALPQPWPQAVRARSKGAASSVGSEETTSRGRKGLVVPPSLTFLYV